MSGNPEPSQDNQFVGGDPHTVYMQGPVSRIAPRLSKKQVDGFMPPTSPASPKIVIKVSRLKRPLSSPEYFRAILFNSGPDVAVAGRRARRKLGRIQIILLSLAAFCLVSGGYYSYIGIKSIKVSNLQAASLTRLADSSKATTTSGNSGLSTAKVSASTLASYTVAPTAPRYLKIPEIGVNARVLNVGLVKGGAIGTPEDIYDTAWYNGSSLPGQPGATLIDGHISSWTSHGVFYNLNKLVPGDTLQVERGDGTTFTYKVVKSQIYSVNNVDMNAALKPVVSGSPGLNLITCTGDVIPGTSSFSERLIVFTTQVN
ncbi:MAG: class F sortase [Candidatus Saccharibacteria bacterium]